jgi:hypothetical protein
VDSVEAAWEALHAANVEDWWIGRPRFNERRNEWSLYAYDRTEKVRIGKRSRHWTAVHPTQNGVIRTMAYCLTEFAAGRVPK